MADFGTIQSRVRRNIIDLPAPVTADVPVFINDAIRSIQDDHTFTINKTVSGFLSTTDGERELGGGPVPTTFKEHRGRPYLLRFDGSTRYVLIAPNRQSLIGRFNEEDEGEPRFILRGDANNVDGEFDWGVWPLPDGESDYADGEYRIVIPYAAYLPDLVNNGDTNWFTVKASRYVEYAATSLGFLRDWDEERAAIWAGLANNEQRRVIKMDKIEVLSQMDTLVPHWEGANAPTHPE